MLRACTRAALCFIRDPKRIELHSLRGAGRGVRVLVAVPALPMRSSCAACAA
jgi:hypothetical protein